MNDLQDKDNNIYHQLPKLFSCFFKIYELSNKIGYLLRFNHKLPYHISPSISLSPPPNHPISSRCKYPTIHPKAKNQF